MACVLPFPSSSTKPRDPIQDPVRGDRFHGSDGFVRTFHRIDGEIVRYFTSSSSGSMPVDRWNSWMAQVQRVEAAPQVESRFGETISEGDTTQGFQVFPWGRVRWQRDTTPGALDRIDVEIDAYGLRTVLQGIPRGSAPAVAFGIAEGLRQAAGLDGPRTDRVRRKIDEERARTGGRGEVVRFAR